MPERKSTTAGPALTGGPSAKPVVLIRLTCPPTAEVFSDFPIAMLYPLLLTDRGITVGAISVGSRADLEAMNRAIVLHRLRPVLARTFPFAVARDAYRHFEGRGHFGTVVVTHAWPPPCRFAAGSRRRR